MVLQPVRETGLDTGCQTVCCSTHCHNRILSIKILHNIYNSRYILDSFKWDLWRKNYHHVQDVVTYLRETLKPPNQIKRCFLPIMPSLNITKVRSNLGKPGRLRAYTFAKEPLPPTRGGGEEGWVGRQSQRVRDFGNFYSVTMATGNSQTFGTFLRGRRGPRFLGIGGEGGEMEGRRKGGVQTPLSLPN